VPFRPTHDLVELRRQCQQFDTGFGQFVNAAQVLTPYATRFRYPGGPLHPSQLEAEQALTFAGDILRYVRQRLNV